LGATSSAEGEGKDSPAAVEEFVKDLRGQLISALLVVVTAAALVSAAINFQQQKLYHLPDDGVTWVDRNDPATSKPIVLALHIVPDSAADRAGVKQGDLLAKINNYQVQNSLDASRVLARVGAWREAEYIVQRGGVELKAKVIVRERVTESSLYYLYVVGLAYLIIGLFVYFRRSRARHATHFYLLCLASFVLFTFHYTGKLNNFDKVIYWANVIAGLLAPTLFLHFALAFPEKRWWLAARWRALLLYLPAAGLSLIYFGLASGILRTAMPLGELRWALDRVWLTAISVLYLAGAAVSWLAYRRAEDPMTRQQLKWLRNGALFGVLPFTLFNTIPYLLGSTTGFTMNLAVLPLLLIPAAWAYAILRYRLMDVDVIFQQGFTYTFATLGVMGIFYMLVLSKGPIEEMNPSTVALLLMVATFIFQPLRNWIQEILDRYVFYKDRYDYRRTLVEFARELSSETNLDAMLLAVADRLRRTLYIRNVAFFLAEEGKEGYHLTRFIGDDPAAGDELDLSFLTNNPTGTVFFERTRMALDVVSRHMPLSVRQTVARLNLTYYVPCQVRGRTIAYLGASRTDQGEFLSSEDLELLETLSGYVGIAIENARLYRSLQQKVVQYERLKEFSENIVESINVGIVAADLDDSVESWNSQMEALTGISRERATRCPLSELFPAHLMRELDSVRGEAGVHQLYKIPLRARAWPSVQAANGLNGNNGHGSNGAVAIQQIPAERLLNVAIAPLVTKEGDQIGRLIIIDDVTERAELEQRLVQTDKLSSIGLLAAGVAHEVNTPLAVISTYAQMLTKQIQGDDPKSKMLEKIAKQTFRASEIVNSLLNFSRTSKTEFEDMDVNRVVRETLSLIEHQLEKAGVKVELDAALPLPPVRGNFGKLQQVFLNLFLNARDAMDEGGTLLVRTTEGDGHARIQVSDTGRGIVADDLARIYDPFFTTKGAKKGTGLGLAVTYGIIREHGGTIDVKSTPGKGTTFTVDLPLVRKPVNA
jgi:signal transduction histidine kinase